MGRMKNRIFGLWSLILLLSGVPALADVGERPQAISFELLGRGLLYSINFDRMVSEKFLVGAGLSAYSISGEGVSSTLFVVPIFGNYYFSPGVSHGFVTAGVDVLLASESVGGNGVFVGSGLAPVAGGGYEYRGDGGFLFRAAPYAVFGRTVLVWFGTSFGYAF